LIPYTDQRLVTDASFYYQVLLLTVVLQSSCQKRNRIFIVRNNAAIAGFLFFNRLKAACCGHFSTVVFLFMMEIAGTGANDAALVLEKLSNFSHCRHRFDMIIQTCCNG